MKYKLLETPYYSSKFQGLWAYLWILSCSELQLNNLLYDVKYNPANVDENFLWALGFLERNFGV